MSITLHHLYQAGATLQIKSLGCGTVTQLAGQQLSAHCDLSLDMGDFQRRCSCRRYRWSSEVTF